ncbi:MAG: VTT domain-containing protein [Anaerolineae bacterium]
MKNSPLRNVNWWPWLGAGLIIAILLLLWKPVSQIGTDPAIIRGWIEPLGPFAPVAFFLLNVIQIVVAPIPGYPVQVLGGILFGFIPGAIYTVGGMVVGGTLAAWLARRLGRPWLEKQLSPATLERWGAIAHIDSFWVWWLLLLLPVLGDFIYFVAGLSKIRLRTFALAILLSRGPFTAFIVWTGSSAAELPWQWLGLMMAVVGLLVILAWSQRVRLEGWAHAFVIRQTVVPRPDDELEIG